jgi:hypothetical protein
MSLIQFDQLRFDMINSWRLSLHLFAMALLACEFQIGAIRGQEPIRSGLGLNQELSLLGGVLHLDATADPASGCISAPVCEQDEVWLINGRLGHCNPCDLGLLTVQKFELGQWQASSLDALLGSHVADQSRTTLIYVHGDRTDDAWALSRGMQFYENVFVKTAEHRKGVRFVIWAWQSEKAQLRPSKDFSVKSSRAKLVGKSLANALKEFPDRRLVLVGYSLGCQAFLVGLQELSCIHLQTRSSTGAGFRVCLLAPALDGNFVAAQHFHWGGAELVEAADIFDNSADRALKCARVIGARKAAGGGQSIQKLACQGGLPLSNVSIFDLRNSVGNKHGVAYYSADPTLGCRLRQMVDMTGAELAVATVDSPAPSSATPK